MRSSRFLKWLLVGAHLTLASCGSSQSDEPHAGSGTGGAGGNPGGMGPGGSGNGGGGAAAGVSGAAGNSSGAGAPGTVPLDRFAEAVAEAICAYMEACDLAWERDEYPAGCTAYESTGYGYGGMYLAIITRGLEQGFIRYDAATMSRCLSTIAAWDCSETNPWLLGLDRLCPDAVDGTTPLGAACFDDIECTGDASCESDSTCPGTCVARHAPGAPCEFEEECQIGHSCTSSGASNGTCVRDGALGEPCGMLPEGSVGCRSGGSCDALPDAAGTCQPLAVPGLGEACTGFGVPCAEGLDCALVGVDAGGTYEYRCDPPLPAGRCRFTTRDDGCLVEEYCTLTTADLNAGVFESSCAPRATAGEACSTDRQCAALVARCANGTCETIGLVGNPCTEPLDCYLAYQCVTGRCNLPQRSCPQ